MCAIKPCLEDRAVTGKELAKLISEIRDIFISTIGWMIPIPWREIYAEFKTIFPTRL